MTVRLDEDALEALDLLTRSLGASATAIIQAMICDTAGWVEKGLLDAAGGDPRSRGLELLREHAARIDLERRARGTSGSSGSPEVSN